MLLASNASRLTDRYQGGTSGIGAEVVRGLASRGAQIILLTHHELTDLFLVDYLEDLRSATGNELIYAEQVDLSSLHSIRLFATKWVDNAPPRRLDMIVLCADTMTPSRGTPKTTTDGVEEEWQVNYLSTFHLLSILSPAIRAQPADRDVRILFSTCSSYLGGTLKVNDTEKPTKNGSFSYKRSKLALMVFVQSFQKHLDAYKRPDGQPMNARSFVVDPGNCRTPGYRRWLTGGSLYGLAIYLITWPLWWLILKSPVQGAQTYFYAAMEAELARGPGGKLLKECGVREILRPEVRDEKVAKTLWEFSEKQVERLEKEGAVKRALAKKEAEGIEKKEPKKSTPRKTSEETDPVTSAKENGGPKPGSRRSKKAK